MATITRKWECCQCGEPHDTQVAAGKCCGSAVIDVFECSCGMINPSEEHARACCGADPDEPIRVTPAELEAAGQQRLDF